MMRARNVIPSLLADLQGGSKGEAAWTLNTKSSSARPTRIWWTKNGRSSRPFLTSGIFLVGMAAFQASDDTQWDYIKRRIDDSDYYVLIVAERYGSELKGKSYTQMEYGYAVAQGVPTVAFLLEGGAPKTWAAEKVEFEKKAKLERFRKLYEKEARQILAQQGRFGG
ncbi:MAG: DUF4062 domain-containing protein [Mesorhizobium sp.]|nr:MAG: DUF4062 domain-containing protein [Mesorhizobium sp.]